MLLIGAKKSEPAAVPAKLFPKSTPPAGPRSTGKGKRDGLPSDTQTDPLKSRNRLVGSSPSDL